jgi:hypothetical protein
VDGDINDATFGDVLKSADPRIGQVALKFNFQSVKGTGIVSSVPISLPAGTRMQYSSCAQFVKEVYVKFKLMRILAVAAVLACTSLMYSQDAAKDVEKGAKDTGHATETAAKDTGKAADKTAKAGEKVTKKTAHGVKKGVKDVGKGVAKGADKTADEVKK